jgi:hypothetical protein
METGVGNVVSVDNTQKLEPSQSFTLVAFEGEAASSIVIFLSIRGANQEMG